MRKHKAILNYFVPNILSSRILLPLLAVLLAGQKNQSRVGLSALSYSPGVKLLPHFLLHQACHVAV